MHINHYEPETHEALDVTLEAWTLHILMKRFLRRKCKFVKNKQVSDGRENDAAKTIAFYIF